MASHSTDQIATERKFRDLLEAAPDAMIIGNERGLIELVNAQAIKMFGYSAEEMVGHSLEMLMPERFRGGHERPAADCFADLLVLHADQGRELLARRKDGSEFPAEVTLSPLKSAGGGLVIRAIRDITARRQVEQALVSTTELLEFTGEVAKVGGWELDLRTMKLSWTQQTFRIFEVDPPEAPPFEQVMSFLPPVARQVIEPALEAAIDRGIPYDHEVPVLTAKGRPIWVRTQGRAVMENGKAVKIFGALHDITERKHADAKLKESEERYRRIVQTTEEGIWTIDAESRTDFVNPKMAQMLGYTVEEMLGRQLADFMDGEGRAISENNVKRRQQGIAEQHDFKFLRKDGSELWTLLSTNPITDASGVYAGALAMATDITKRKKIELALYQSESLFRTLAEVSPVGIFRTDCSGQIVYVNAQCCHILGVSPELLMGFGWSSTIYPDDRERVVEGWMQAVAAKRGFVSEQRFQHADGRLVWCASWSQPEQNSVGEIIGHVGVLIDITERKQAETALHESEERYRLLADNTDDIVSLNDTEGNSLYKSPSYFRKTGWTPEDLNSQDWHTRIHPDDVEIVERARNDNLAGKATRIEHRTRCKDGSWLWYDTNCKPLPGPDGKVWRLLVWSHDITERKQIEKALRDNEERLSLATLHAGVGIWDWDLITRKLVWDDSMFALYHIRREDFSGTEEAWLSSLHPDDLERAKQEGQDAISARKPFDMEFRIVWPSGEVRFIKAVAKVFHDEQGTPSRMLGTNWDITASKQADEALRQSENRLSSIFNSLSEVIFLLDMDQDGEFRFNTVNPAFLATTGLPLESVVGRNVKDVIPEPSLTMVLGKYRQAAHEKVSVRWEETSDYPTGRLTALVTVTPVLDANGICRQLAGSVRDITDRKQAEESIRQLNAQLETRVAERTAELHLANEELREQITLRRQLEEEILAISEREQQRIGQDLHDDLGQQLAGAWMMSSALARSLASRGIPEEHAATRISDLLEKSVALTRSLARGLHPVEPEPGGLMSALHALATRVSELFQIDCSFECDTAAPLDDTIAATHLYRIAQEAVTNSIKHGKARSVRINLSSDNKATTLTVTDAGTGMERTEPVRQGMGLRIMHYRAGRIGATLAIENQPQGGISVTCILPKTSTLV